MVKKIVTLAVTFMRRSYGMMLNRKAEPHAQAVLMKAATRSIYEPAAEPNKHRRTPRRAQRVGDPPAGRLATHRPRGLGRANTVSAGAERDPHSQGACPAAGGLP